VPTPFQPDLGLVTEETIKRLLAASAHLEPSDVRALVRELKLKGLSELKPSASPQKGAAQSQLPARQGGKKLPAAVLLDAH
jgi:ribosomal protein L12E/L44/L45/RPP1/RPP2